MRASKVLKTVLLPAVVFGILFSAKVQSSVEPANKVDIVLTPAVAFSKDSDEFHFAYDLASKFSSQQMLVGLSIAINEQQGIKSISPPPKTSQWIGLQPIEDRDLGSPVIDWFPERKITDLSQANIVATEAIHPGETLKGFRMVALNLPGIRLFWVKGFVPPPTEQEIVDFVNGKHATSFTNLSEVPSAFIKEVPVFQPDHVNAVSGNTVGPDILPDGLTNDQLLARLISLKEQAAQLGWIDEETAERLDKKLKAAKDKLQEGETRTAGNILHSFIHDLQAQHRKDDHDKDHDRDKHALDDDNDRAKHVSDNAFYLLEPNAEFILSKLEQAEKSHDKDEDRDRKQHEGR